MNSPVAFLSTLVLTVIAAASGCGQPSAASPGHSATAAATPLSAGAVDVARESPDAPASALDAEPDPSTTAEAAPPSVAEPTAPQPAGQRPPADRGPARPGEAEKISFDDLNLGMIQDMVYRPFLLTDRVKELDGKRLSIIGYMHGGVESNKNVKEFVLLKNTECKFGPGGQADHLAQVYLEEGHATDFTKKPVKVEATLKVQSYEGSDGNTWAIYRLEEAKIVR